MRATKATVFFEQRRKCGLAETVQSALPIMSMNDECLFNTYVGVDILIKQYEFQLTKSIVKKSIELKIF